MRPPACFLVSIGAIALFGFPSARAGDSALSSVVLQTVEYDGEGTSHFSFRNMAFTIDAVGLQEARGPRLRVAVDGKPAFKLQLAGESGNGSATVKIVRLEGDEPQIVFQHFTFGAHCCVVTKIATRAEGHWHAVAVGAIDGDGGYGFEDIDRSGFGELIGIDQSFLYAFTGYASSRAPILLQKLNGTALIDVTHDARYRKAVLASLNAMEPKSADDDLWHDNGYLAAWVATKALLGDGPTAWRRMLKVYNATSDWKMEFVTFPESLRAHLLAHRYITDESLYPLPAKS